MKFFLTLQTTLVLGALVAIPKSSFADAKVKFVAGRDLKKYCDAVFPGAEDSVRDELEEFRKALKKNLAYLYEAEDPARKGKEFSFGDLAREMPLMKAKAQEAIRRAKELQSASTAKLEKVNASLKKSGQSPLNDVSLIESSYGGLSSSAKWDAREQRQSQVRKVLQEIESYRYHKHSELIPNRYGDEAYPHTGMVPGHANYPDVFDDLYDRLVKLSLLEITSEQQAKGIPEEGLKEREFKAAMSKFVTLRRNRELLARIQNGWYPEGYHKDENGRIVNTKGEELKLPEPRIISKKDVYDAYHALVALSKDPALSKTLQRLPELSEPRQNVKSDIANYATATANLRAAEYELRDILASEHDMALASDFTKFSARLQSCNQHCNNAVDNIIDVQTASPEWASHTGLNPAAVDVEQGILNPGVLHNLKEGARNAGEACLRPWGYAFNDFISGRALKEGHTGGARVLDIQHRNRYSDVPKQVAEFIKRLDPPRHTSVESTEDFALKPDHSSENPETSRRPRRRYEVASEEPTSPTPDRKSKIESSAENTKTPISMAEVGKMEQPGAPAEEQKPVVPPPPKPAKADPSLVAAADAWSKQNMSVGTIGNNEITFVQKWNDPVSQAHFKVLEKENRFAPGTVFYLHNGNAYQPKKYGGRDAKGEILWGSI